MRYFERDYNFNLKPDYLYIEYLPNGKFKLLEQKKKRYFEDEEKKKKKYQRYRYKTK